MLTYYKIFKNRIALLKALLKNEGLLYMRKIIYIQKLSINL